MVYGDVQNKPGRLVVQEATDVNGVINFRTTDRKMLNSPQNVDSIEQGDSGEVSIVIRVLLNNGTC